MVASSFLMVLQILSGFFPNTQFSKKQTKAAHANAAKECISSMINKIKTSSYCLLSLNWALMFIVLVKTHTDNPFQWKPLSELLKKVKKSTAEYNRQHSSKLILNY